MEHRLGRTLRVFLIVLAAAGFHRLTVVPLVEPRMHDANEGVEMSPEEAAAIRARADRRLAALGDIFPAGSWEREDPIMLESRQMRLLFKQYQALPDGRVNLVPCTLVILPDRNRVAADGEAGRTLVLRVPQGAVLEFDEPLDLRQGRLARLIGGSLRGQVTIRGTPSAPGADDDIEIVTRDVELEEFEVHTAEMVQFRYGRSTGSGRALLARLLPRAGASGQGPSIGGIDSIRLDRDVQLRLEGMQGGILPGQKQPKAGGQSGSAAEAAPVLVSCRGGLCLNVSANVITCEDQVEVVRTVPGGSTDQLACDLLAIVLGRQETAGGAEGSRSELRPLEIQAKGTPVVARSSSAGLEARAARLGYEIATRRILLDGEEPVSLVARGTEMEARSIDYVPGPSSAPGALMAVGPGWLRTRSAGSPPVQARWQKWLRMRPDGEGHVASIAGDAEVAVETQGRLSGSEMHLWLELAAPATAAGVPPAAVPLEASGAGPDLSGVRPTRMLARGMVEVEAEQLTARTDRMEVWFRNQEPAAAPAVGVAPPPPRGLPVAAQPGGPQSPASTRGPSSGKLVATAALVRGLVTMAGNRSELEEMSLEGQVHVIEEPNELSERNEAGVRNEAGGTAAAGPRDPGREAAMEIRGDQMQLTRPTRFDARAIVSGRPAEVRGRGLDLQGPLVDFDRGRNRLTVDGAGTLKVPLAAGTGGFESFGFTGSMSPTPAAITPQNTLVAVQAAAPPGALDVAWQGRMDFDGLTARFVDRVVTSSGSTVVRAGSLDVVFNRPIEFSAGQPQPATRPDVSRIACGSGVRIESESAAQDGTKSVEQLFVRDLVIDRTTGNVTGTGPGRLASTRFGQAPGMSLPAGPQAPAAAPMGPGFPATPTPATGPTPVATAAQPDELTYLGVDFQRGMRGNINRRVMEFHQRVEAIWGPVAKWGDTLDPHAAGGLPPRVVTISSDVLGVGQAPPAPGQRKSTIELAAGGNVLVEGESFTARSARLTWSEAKDLLVFEGDGRSDAQLYRQARVGAATSSASAGKILYWRALNRVDVDDARFLDLDQLGAGAAGLGSPGLGGGSPAPARPVSRPTPGT
jgi:hypothetical protein